MTKGWHQESARHAQARRTGNTYRNLTGDFYHKRKTTKEILEILREPTEPPKKSTGWRDHWDKREEDWLNKRKKEKDNRELTIKLNSKFFSGRTISSVAAKKEKLRGKKKR